MQGKRCVPELVQGKRCVPDLFLEALMNNFFAEKIYNIFFPIKCGYCDEITEDELKKLNIFVSQNAVVQKGAKIYFNSCFIHRVLTL